MKKTSLLITSIVGSLILSANQLSASDCIIGEVRQFAGSFVPRGYELCDGKLLSISQNTALFSILGTMYGGDGRTTFALPKLNSYNDLRKSKVVNIICVNGLYPSRK